MTTAQATPPSTDRGRGGLTRLVALLVSLTMLGLVGVGTASAAPPATDGVTVPVAGTADTGQAFTGALDISRVQARNGALEAVGTLTGAVDGVSVAAQQVTLPLQATGTCEILSLVLGPLDLNLLGLVIHLDQIVLTIDAQQGPGNLLGNLLCAVAGLLDGTGGLGGIAALLNRILGALG